MVLPTFVFEKFLKKNKLEKRREHLSCTGFVQCECILITHHTDGKRTKLWEMSPAKFKLFYLLDLKCVCWDKLRQILLLTHFYECWHNGILFDRKDTCRVINGAFREKIVDKSLFTLFWFFLKKNVNSTWD